MNNSYNSSIFEHYEYVLVLRPNEDTSDKISLKKKEFSKKYKLEILPGKPQITLARFIHFHSIETKLVSFLKSRACSYRPFQISISDYGSIPSHSIFLNIETTQQIKNLVHHIRPLQSLVKWEQENKPHFMNDFYFLIGRKLLPWQYEKAWNEYRNEHFSAHFISEGFILLRRLLKTEQGKFYPSGHYQTIQQFSFTNSQPKHKQGVFLF